MPERKTFTKTTRIEAPASVLWAWHLQPDALLLLTPPGERVEIVERSHEGIVDGLRVVLKVGRGLTAMRWIADHRDVRPGEGFTDVMVKGPFAEWVHEHRFLEDGPTASILEDQVTYRLPLGVLGRILLGRFIRRKLDRMFAHRHEVTKREVERSARESS